MFHLRPGCRPVSGREPAGSRWRLTDEELRSRCMGIEGQTPRKNVMRAPWMSGQGN
jgi:hypothetical protein